MPTWNPESPYIWLEKPLLKGLSFVVFGLDGSLSPPGLEFLALQPGEANPLSESLKRLVTEHKRQEASRSRVVQEQLPDIANDPGPKPERFSWEERNGVADSFARRGESEARADRRPVTSEQRSSCERRRSQLDRSH